MSTIKHTANGQDYEIRSLQTEEGWIVAIFRDGHRLAVYSVASETMQDSRHSTVPIDIDTLFDFAKADLDAGIVK